MLLLLTGVMCMAISFNTNGITNQQYGTSTVDKFNGVDKTTTPTEVDNSRAIEMSNYLPDGNSLVKRYGVKKIELDILEKATINLNINDIELLDWWKYKDYDICFIKCNHTITSDNVSTTYHFGFLYKNSTSTNPTFYGLSGNSTDVTHSQAIDYEGKLFILCNCGYYLFDNNGFVPVFDYSTNTLNDNIYIPSMFKIPTYNSSDESDDYSGLLEIDKYNISTNKFYARTQELINTKLNLSVAYRSYQTIPATNNWCCVQIGLSGYIKVNEMAEGEFLNTNNKLIIDFTEMDNYEQIIQSFNYKVEIPYTYSNNKITFNLSYEGFSEDVGVWLKADENGNFSTTKVMDYIKNYKFKIPYVKKTGISINDFKYIKSYGVNGYTDRLFVYGNPNYPNVDIHSGYASQTIKRWQDYTYFPDDSYQSLGSSDNAITGYGILSNGVMAIFKQSKNNEPNLYFRSAINATQMSSSGTVESSMYGLDEYYPITVSGINIGSDYENQVIQFGNDLLINTPSGLYKIEVGTSTATQTYLVKEVSYFLRNEWSSDMTGSIHCVFGNKLYIKRKNKEGKYRIYVADMNRYSFKDSIQQYEWWILDDINVDMFKVVDNQLYLINSNGLYNFNEGSFYDEDYVYTNQIRVGDEWIESELFFDKDDDEFILSTGNYYIEEANNSSDKQSAYNEIKSNMQINYTGDAKLMFKDIEFEQVEHLTDITVEVDNESITLSRELINIKGKDMDLLYSIWCNMAIAQYGLTYISCSFSGTEENLILNVEYISTTEVNIIYAYNSDGVTWEELVEAYNNLYTLTNTIPALYIDIKELSNKHMLTIAVDEMYCFKDNVRYDLSHVFKNEDKLIYANTDTGQYVELGDVYFNTFTYVMMFNGIKYSNVRLKLNGISSVLYSNRIIKITMKKPVKAYWYSHFNQCNRIDYLKTADYMYFVPETKRGGLTHIGYRTNKKEVGYDARYFTKQLDFNDIDEFGFGELEFGHSISSKKKIKNFAFIQLIAYSNNEKDSTLAQLTFRYRYTKNNKGVK